MVAGGWRPERPSASKTDAVQPRGRRREAARARAGWALPLLATAAASRAGRAQAVEGAWASSGTAAERRATGAAISSINPTFVWAGIATRIELRGEVALGDEVAWAASCSNPGQPLHPANGTAASTYFTLNDAGSFRLCFRASGSSAFVEQPDITLTVQKACVPEVVPTLAVAEDGGCAALVASVEDCTAAAARHPLLPGGLGEAEAQSAYDRPLGCWWQPSNGALFFNTYVPPPGTSSEPCTEFRRCICCDASNTSSLAIAEITPSSVVAGDATEITLGGTVSPGDRLAWAMNCSEAVASQDPTDGTRASTEFMLATPGDYKLCFQAAGSTIAVAQQGITLEVVQPCVPEIYSSGSSCPWPIASAGHCSLMAGRQPPVGPGAGPALAMSEGDRPSGCWWQPATGGLFFNTPPSEHDPVDCTDDFRCVCCKVTSPPSTQTITFTTTISSTATSTNFTTNSTNTILITTTGTSSATTSTTSSTTGSSSATTSSTFTTSATVTSTTPTTTNTTGTATDTATLTESSSTSATTTATLASTLEATTTDVVVTTTAAPGSSAAISSSAALATTSTATTITPTSTFLNFTGTLAPAVPTSNTITTINATSTATTITPTSTFPNISETFGSAAPSSTTAVTTSTAGIVTPTDMPLNTTEPPGPADPTIDTTTITTATSTATYFTPMSTSLTSTETLGSAVPTSSAAHATSTSTVTSTTSRSTTATTTLIASATDATTTSRTTAVTGTTIGTTRGTASTTRTTTDTTSEPVGTRTDPAITTTELVQTSSAAEATSSTHTTTMSSTQTVTWAVSGVTVTTSLTGRTCSGFTCPLGQTAKLDMAALACRGDACEVAECCESIAGAAYLVVGLLAAGRRLADAREGLRYRLSKRLDAIDTSLPQVEPGTTVWGQDEGDGWLRVGDRFLPFIVGEAAVVIPEVLRLPSGSLATPVPLWVVGPWSPCLQPCGQERRNRLVLCPERYGESLCRQSGTRPSKEAECDSRAPCEERLRHEQATDKAATNPVLWLIIAGTVTVCASMLICKYFWLRRSEASKKPARAQDRPIEPDEDKAKVRWDLEAAASTQGVPICDNDLSSTEPPSWNDAAPGSDVVARPEVDAEGEDEDGDPSRSRRCAEGHILSAVAVPWSGDFACDGCGQELPEGTLAWSCGLCRLELCGRCALAPGEVDSEQQAVLCPAGHQCRRVASRGLGEEEPVKCSSCVRDDLAAWCSHFYRCDECRYSVCLQCAPLTAPAEAPATSPTPAFPPIVAPAAAEAFEELPPPPPVCTEVESRGLEGRSRSSAPATKPQPPEPLELPEVSIKL